MSASRILDDVLVVNGSFDPDSAAYIEKALTAATRPDSEDERRTPAERRADALVEVCRRYLEGLDNPDGNRRQERLTVVADIRVLYRAALRGAGVVTADHLDRFLDARPDLGAVERGLFCDAFEGAGGTASTLDGNPISDGLVSCLSSGGTLERLLTVEGRVLDHGRTIRTFTPAQRRAVLARDRGCRVAGCDAPPQRCDIHHVIPWETGGRTDITNAVTKCRHEHLEHHRRRWPDRIEPDGTYTITTTNGVEHTTRPPGWAPPPELPSPPPPPVYRRSRSTATTTTTTPPGPPKKTPPSANASTSSPNSHAARDPTPAARSDPGALLGAVRTGSTTGCRRLRLFAHGTGEAPRRGVPTSQHEVADEDHPRGGADADP